MWFNIISYISHLLFAVSMPNYGYIAEQYVSLDPKEVDVLVEMADDNYLKYFVYKVNADNLLLQLGLYHDFDVLQSVEGDIPKQKAHNKYQTILTPSIPIAAEKSPLLAWGSKI